MNERQRKIEACRTQAIRMMDSPRGQEAADGGYYTVMFNWLFGELERGRTPAGIPAKLMERWKADGEWRRAAGQKRTAPVAPLGLP